MFLLISPKRLDDCWCLTFHKKKSWTINEKRQRKKMLAEQLHVEIFSRRLLFCRITVIVRWLRISHCEIPQEKEVTSTYTVLEQIWNLNRNQHAFASIVCIYNNWPMFTMSQIECNAWNAACQFSLLLLFFTLPNHE